MSALDDDIFADLLGGSRSASKPESPAVTCTHPADMPARKYPEISYSLQSDPLPVPEVKQMQPIPPMQPEATPEPVLAITKDELEALLKRTVQDALDDAFGKFARSLRTVLEDMSKRIDGQNASNTQNTDKLARELDSFRDALETQTENVHSRFTSVDAALKDLERGVQTIRDKQELTEAQAMLAKLAAPPAAADKMTSTVDTPKHATSQQVFASAPAAVVPAAVQQAPPLLAPQAPQPTLPPPQPAPQPQQPQHQMLQMPQVQQMQPPQSPMAPPQPQVHQQAPPPDLSSQYAPPATPAYQYAQPPPTSQPHMEQYPQQQQQGYPTYSHPPPSGPPPPMMPQNLQQMHHAMPHAPPPPTMAQPSFPPPPQPQGPPPPPPQMPPPAAPPSMPPPQPQNMPPAYPPPSYPAPPISYPPPPSQQGGGFRPGPPPQSPHGPPPPATPPGPPRTSARPVPLDQIISDIANMGFERNQVLNVVNHLQQNGQSIDLNVIIDRLTRGL